MDSLSPGAPRTAMLEDRIRQIVTDVLTISPQSLGTDSHRGQIREWDSLQHLNLVVALEQEFDIEITPDEFDVMNSLAGVLRLVDRKLADRVLGG